MITQDDELLRSRYSKPIASLWSPAHEPRAAPYTLPDFLTFQSRYLAQTF